MTRAAIIAGRGDVFTNFLFVDSFKKIWKDEVDMLYVAIASYFDEEHKKFLRDVVFNDPKIKLFFFDRITEGGDNEPFLIEQSKEDHLVMLEDDVLVFKKLALDEYFKKIENGEFDVIGPYSPALSTWIREKAKAMYGYDAVGPSHRFMKRSDWEKTDKIYKANSFGIGEYKREVDMIMPDRTRGISRGDTGMWNSVELMHAGCRIGYINEVRATAIRPGVPWTHVNSLSGFSNSCFPNLNTMDYVGKMTDIKPFTLEKLKKDAVMKSSIYGKSTPEAKSASDNEHCRILSWIGIAMKKYWDLLSPIDKYRETYKKGYEWWLDASSCPRDLLEQYIKKHEAYITW